MAPFVRRLPLALALLCAPAMAAVHTTSGPGAIQARASVDFRIDIPLVMRLRMVAHPSFVEVTPEDVRRGEIVVAGPAIEIQANGAEGYVISGELTGRAFESAHVEGLPRPLDVGDEPGAALFPAAPAGHREVYAVVYRIRLAADARTGRHPWPVRLAMHRP